MGSFVVPLDNLRSFRATFVHFQIIKGSFRVILGRSEMETGPKMDLEIGTETGTKADNNTDDVM